MMMLSLVENISSCILPKPMRDVSALGAGQMLILHMALSGYTCWIGLGGPGSSQVDKADAGRPKYGSPGAQTTMAVETYLADTHRTP